VESPALEATRHLQAFVQATCISADRPPYMGLCSSAPHGSDEKSGNSISRVLSRGKVQNNSNALHHARSAFFLNTPTPSCPNCYLQSEVVAKGKVLCSMHACFRMCNPTA